MLCSKCEFSNPAGMRYCGNCAAPLAALCAACQAENPPHFRFCGQCGHALSPTVGNDAAVGGPGPGQSNPPPRQIANVLERRQLTVVFVDLVGSSQLSERLDPEDLREIITIYRDRSHGVISRYGGHIAQYLGDGILVYFGYPVASEGDPNRAVRAALALIDSFQKLEVTLAQRYGAELKVRIGIHTGLVVIGEQSSGENDRLALGETPNIAARLQSLAIPNGVCISGITQSLLGGEFQCVSQGSQVLKGFSQEMELFNVAGETDFPLRQTTRSQKVTIPLIGREQECGLMLDRLEQSLEGTGQVVYVTGEPGIGKTRLLREVHERLSVEPHFYIEIQGASHYRNSPFYAVTSYLSRTFKLSYGLSNDQKLEKIQDVFARYALGGAEEMAMVCELLGVMHEFPDVAGADASPQIRKRKTITALFHLLQKMAEGKFLVIVVDDVQWIDPSTMELVRLMVDQASLWRMFVLLAFRNDFQLPWKPHSYLTHISLNRLSRRQVGRLINATASGKALPEELFRQIVSKTDGIPLFIEELMKTILASGKLQEKGGRYELSDALYALQIPATLQDSLMASIDKLGDEKELAQMVATLGREFIYSLLRAVVPMDEEKLQKQLADLVDSDLLQQRGLPPEASYCFRQALLQETAYQSLLKSTRQTYHKRIAGILRDQFPDKIQSHPEVYAHHLTESGNSSEALPYWLSAGRIAVGRYANLEAAEHLNKGLELLRQLADSETYVRQELECLTLLGYALSMSKGYAAPQVEKVFSRANMLCRNVREISVKFPIMAGLWRYYYIRGNLVEARQLADQLQALVDAQSKDTLLRIEADRIMGCTLFWLGEFAPADRYLQAGLPAIREAATTQVYAGQDYSQDPLVANLSNAALVKWFLGEQAVALELTQESIALARAIQHPFSIAYALIFSAIVYELAGDQKQARQLTDEALRISGQYGFSFWSAFGDMMHAWLTRNGDLSAALRSFEAALASFRQSGGVLAQTYFLSLLAQMYLQAARHDMADATIEMALAVALEHQEKYFYPELLRIKVLIAEAAGGDAWGVITDCLTTARQAIDTSGGVALAARLQTTIESLNDQSIPTRYH